MHALCSNFWVVYIWKPYIVTVWLGDLTIPRQYMYILNVYKTSICYLLNVYSMCLYISISVLIPDFRICKNNSAN